MLALAAAAYAFKASGPAFAGGQDVGADLRAVLDLVVVPVLAALIVVQTLDGGRAARASTSRVTALGVAALLVWRRAPLLVVVLAAAGCAALPARVAA